MMERRLLVALLGLETKSGRHDDLNAHLLAQADPTNLKIVTFELASKRLIMFLMSRWLSSKCNATPEPKRILFLGKGDAGKVTLFIQSGPN
jgi:hypothetical protein